MIRRPSAQCNVRGVVFCPQRIMSGVGFARASLDPNSPAHAARASSARPQRRRLVAKELEFRERWHAILRLRLVGRLVDVDGRPLGHLRRRRRAQLPHPRLLRPGQQSHDLGRIIHDLAPSVLITRDARQNCLTALLVAVTAAIPDHPCSPCAPTALERSKDPT